MPTPSESPLSMLKDLSLLKTDALINGQWNKGASRFDILDPSNGRKLADVANLGPADAEAAIASANAAWPAWRGKTAKERSIIMRKWFDLLMQAVFRGERRDCVWRKFCGMVCRRGQAHQRRDAAHV